MKNDVGTELRVATGPGDIHVELYKMLLYEEGDSSKPYKDQEKAPHVFGTLVIRLPSKHEGGDIHVSLPSDFKVFETSKRSASYYLCGMICRRHP